MSFSFAPVLRDDALAGKTIVITGGGTGMGRAMSVRFAQLGANVVIASRKPEVLAAVAGEITAAGGSALAIPTDVRDVDAVDALFAQTRERFGRLDGLVNNAAGNFPIRTLDLSPNGWRTVIDIVLNGTFFCSQRAAKAMIESGGGAILNMIATYAWHGNPYTVHSASAKAGVLAMTQSLAVEWAEHGIRVNAIAPGAIERTGGADVLFAQPEHAEKLRRSIPAARFGTPEEIAENAAFLMSDAAAYVSGACVTIDGARWLGGAAFRF